MRGEGLPERSLLPQREMTPLHMPAALGHLAVVEQLLTAGATVDAKAKVRFLDHISRVFVRCVLFCMSRGGMNLPSIRQSLRSICVLSLSKFITISPSSPSTLDWSPALISTLVFDDLLRDLDLRVLTLRNFQLCSLLPLILSLALSGPAFPPYAPTGVPRS